MQYDQHLGAHPDSYDLIQHQLASSLYEGGCTSGKLLRQLKSSLCQMAATSGLRMKRDL